MQETRRQRLQAVILEELSVVIPREVKDPRIPSLTFTSVEVTPDGGQATVSVSILGAQFVQRPEGAPEPTEAQLRAEEQKRRQEMKDCLAGLASASGFLRRHLAKILTVRHVPTLIFREDRGFENTIRVHELLKQINTSSPKE